MRVHKNNIDNSNNNNLLHWTKQIYIINKQRENINTLLLINNLRRRSHIDLECNSLCYNVCSVDVCMCMK